MPVRARSAIEFAAIRRRVLAGAARKLVDGLRSGKPPAPSRGSAPLCTFRQTERILAGFPDPRPDEGQGGAGAATLAGLRAAKERNMTAPPPESSGKGQ